MTMLKKAAKLVVNIVGFTGIGIAALSLVGFVITGSVASWLWAFQSDAPDVWGRFFLAFITSFFAGISLVVIAVVVEGVVDNG